MGKRSHLHHKRAPISFRAPSAKRLRRRRGAHAGVLDALERRVLMAATDVTINEIMYNSASFETADEYVELYNKGPTPVSLSGWRFESGIDYTFGNTTIGADQYLVVSADLARFAQKYPGVSNVVGPWTGQLSNSSNTIRLVNASGSQIDEVRYADDGDWAVRRRGGEPYKKVAQIIRSGTNATVTVPAHGYSNGNRVAIFGANQAPYDGIFTISGTTATTFTIPVSGSPATPATGEIFIRRADLNHFGWDWFNLADGGGKSMELINPNLANQHGQNWAPSIPDNGTPGAANSVASTNLAPMILNMTHFPIVPRSGEFVTVTAELKDESSSGLSAKVVYRDDKAGTWEETGMFDDGIHGDGQPGDGLWGAWLPGKLDDTVVEFYIEATDTTGKSRTWPGPTDVTGERRANALYQVDDTQYTFTPGGQPVFKIIMTDAERVELDTIGNAFPEANSNAEMNATWISIDGDGTDLRYVTGVRNRGGGSRVAAVNNYHVNFGAENPWHGVTSTNFNAIYSASEVAAWALLSRAGVYGQTVTPAQVRVNNANLARADLGMFGSYSWIESEDNEFVESHFPNDDQGNYYRAVDGTHESHLAYRGTNVASYASYAKQTNVEQNDYSDLINLTYAFSTNTAEANFASTISQLIDVTQWMRYFAVNILLGTNETTIATGRGDDYALYRGTNDTRFKIIAHDLDTILTLGETQSAINQTIFRAALGVPDMTLRGSSIRRLLQNQHLVPIYYQQLKHLIDTVFTQQELTKTLYHALGGYLPSTAIDTAIDNGVKRAAATLAQIPLDLNVTKAPATSGGFPKVTAPDLNAAVLAGRSHAIDTRSVKVNGASAVWSAYGANWSFTNTANAAGLKPGINRVLVQAFDASNVEVDRSYIDIWYDDASVAPKTGAITATTTWTSAGGPYLVSGNVTVNSGVALTIEAGTTVYFAPGAKLIVNGVLSVAGTPDNRVKFTRNVAGGTNATWAGIQFNNSGSANRIAYADIEYATSPSYVIDINASRVDLVGIAFPKNIKTSGLIDISGNSSFRLQDSVIPDVQAIEPIIAAGTIPATGYAVIQGNTFGTTTGHNDIIDWTGGKRNAGGTAPILQILNNTFTGTGTGFTEADDILDLDATDAHIEGNVFMNVYPSSTPDTNSAISGGVNNSITSHWVSVRNIFYNVDHAFLAKEGNFVTSVNDTFVKVLTGAFNFSEPGFSASPGLGGVADGAIFYDLPANNGVPVIVQNPPTGSFAVRNSVLPGAWAGAVNSVIADPQFVNPNNVTDPRKDLAVKPTSPAKGRGPNGRDAGFDIPVGASVSGEPTSPSLRNTATLTVGGPDIWAYKYKLDNGAWSAEVPVTNPGRSNAVIPPIQLTNLANGNHTVFVVRKNSAGVWQPDAEPTASKTWTVAAAANTGRIRINEVLADNQTAHNNGGHFLDVIELYNDGTGAIDLSDYSITDDPTNPRKFVFPAGTTPLAAGQHLILYASNPESGATGTFLRFSLRQAGEGVYLYNKPSSGGALIDSVVFGIQLRDKSIGRVGDGSAWALAQPTVGAANVALPTGDPHKLRINEWQAGAADPFNDDYVELYNPNPQPVTLGGLYISDKASDWPTKHVFTPLSFIDANGYLALLADEDTTAGADHLNFNLDKDRGKIALYDNQQTLIDYLFYDNQADGTSEGLQPDGSDKYVFFPGTRRSPGLSNVDPDVVKNTLTLINLDGVWSYDQTNSFDNTAPNPWFGTNFVDSGWATGRAILWDDDDAIVGPTNTPLALGRTTYYFRRHFTLNADPSTIDRLLVTAVIDDGAVLYLNGQLAHKLNMPTNSANVTYGTLARTNINNAGFSFFELPRDALQFGDNLLAVEVHQSATNSSDVAFGLELKAEQTIINPPPPPLRITEINYNSPGAGGISGDETEFIELLNIGSEPLNLTDYEFTGGVLFEFPDNFTLAPGARTVVVKNLNAFRARYGNAVNAAGQYFDSLDNGGEVIRLVSNTGRVIHDFIYSDEWYPSTDGDGHTLVINDPNGDPSNWGQAFGWHASTTLLGTPGTIDGTLTTDSLIISEVLASSTGGAKDWIEIRNTTGSDIDISGWYLSDSDANLLKYRLPPGTIVPALGYLVLDEAQHFGNLANGTNAFSLSSAGDDVYLSSSETPGQLSGYREGVSFGASSPGVPMGRYQTSTGRIDFVALSRATRGADNALPLVGPVIFNEVMYNPASGRDEYMELKNISAAAVQLFDPANPNNTWRFASGVGFTFPTGLSLGAGRTMLIVGIDPAAFRAKYSIPASVQIIGPWTGSLDDNGGRLELLRPGTPLPVSGEVPWLRVDSLSYDDEGPWPGPADGTGPSLGRFVETHYGDDVANWRAESPLGSPGAANAVSPLTAAAEFLETSPQKLVVRFSKNVQATLQKEDLLLQNLRTGDTIVPAVMNMTYDAASNIATWTFGGITGGMLPQGRYRATLSASSVSTPAGEFLDGNRDGFGGDDYFFEFHHLPGDMDGDGKVTFADFQALERNFGKTGATWQMGDFNFDTIVNSADFAILQANFGADFSAAAPVPTTPVTTPAPTPIPVTPAPTPMPPPAARKPAPAKKPTPVSRAAATPKTTFSATRITKRQATPLWA